MMIFIAKKFVLPILERLKNDRYCMLEENLKNLLFQAAKDTVRKRGVANLYAKPISRRYLTRFVEEHGIKQGNAEDTTKARVEAADDCRNAISYVALAGYVSKNIEQALTLNMDATQFCVGYDKGKMQVFHMKEDNSLPLKVLPSPHTGGDLHYFVKFYLIITAQSRQSDPVFVIADDSMDPESIDVHPFSPLTLGTSDESTAYIVFCKTRCCNDAFYVWINTTVIIPFISKLRRIGLFDESEPAYLQVDGEPKQIACYNTPTLLQALTNNNIVVGKSPASTSALFQPCDRGNMFKAAKTRLKSITDSTVKNDQRIARLTALFKDHVERAKNSHQQCNTNVDFHPLSHNHLHHGVYGLLRVHQTLMDTTSPDRIAHSFGKCGLHPFDVCTILRNSTHEWTCAEETAIMESIDALVADMELYGEVSDEKMTAMGFPRTVDKDNRVTHQRRSLLLSSAVVIQRHRVAKQAKAKTPKKRKAEHVQRLSFTIPGHVVKERNRNDSNT